MKIRELVDGLSEWHDPLTDDEQDWIQASLPRCDSLDGSSLEIVPFYTEAGRYCEANCIKVRDKEGRIALFAPYAVVLDKSQQVAG